MAESDYVLVGTESQVSNCRHLSELHISGFASPQQRLRDSTPGAQGMAPYVREGFHSFQQSQLECSCHESRVFRICSKITICMFMPFTVTQGTMVHFMTVSLPLWLGCNQLMIRLSLSLSLLVMPMLITVRSQSLLLIDMGVMLLIFVICHIESSWYVVLLKLLVIDSIL